MTDGRIDELKNRIKTLDKEFRSIFPDNFEEIYPEIPLGILLKLDDLRSVFDKYTSDL